MELEGKRSCRSRRSISSSKMIAASVLVTLIAFSTLTIGMATPAAAQQLGETPGASSSNAACGQVVSGIVNLTAGNLSRAKEWFKKAMELDPNSDAGKKAQELLTSH